MITIRRLVSGAILLFGLLLTAPLAHGQVARAQSTFSPTLHLLHVDTTQFPVLEIALSGPNWPEPLSTLPATVTLDGRKLAIDSDQTVESGIQVALAIDANQLTTSNEAGQSGYVALTGTLLDLVEANVFVRNADWLAAYQLQGDNEPLSIQEWTQEPNLIFNEIVDNRPADTQDAALSAQSLLDLIAQMEAAPETEMLPRLLLLFSTGAGVGDLQPAVEAAQAAHVAIHVVELQGDANEAPNNALQALANQSGGHYTALTGPELSTAVGEALTAAHNVRVLRSRADSASPQSLTVTVTLLDYSEVTATSAATTFADLNIAPMQIALAAPAAETISWDALTGGADAATRLLPVQASFEWPDGHPREVIQATYTLRGPGDFAQQEIRTEAPFDQVALPLANLQEGDYTLEIRTLDELAIETELSTAGIRFGELPTSAQPASAQTGATEADAAAVNAPAGDAQGAVAQAADAGSALDASSTLVQTVSNSSQPSDRVQIPGTQLEIPRALLVWSLPILLLLIGYLIYSERRDRRRAQSQTKTKAAPRSSAADNPLFDLRDDSQPLADERFQLNAQEQNHTRRFTLEADPAEGRRPAPTTIADPKAKPEAPGRNHASVYNQVEEHVIREDRSGGWQENDELHWDDEEDFEDEVTVVPARMEDEEATYRTEQVERPIVGHLIRTTSDPNLPRELPIYGLNARAGELRQIHIGRHSKHNTVVISDKRISREHAVIIQRDGRLYLRDNASSAGTFLNWKRLNPGEELLLRHNDIISFGEVVYEFRLHGEDEATLPNA